VTEILNSGGLRIEDLVERLDKAERQIKFLEERLLSYYKNRWDAIDKLADYLVGAQLPGHYCEFGVFNGTTFSYFVKIGASLFPNMDFVAFDSFSGLPELTGQDHQDGYSSGFHKGEFACSEQSFIANLVANGAPMDRVHTVAGFFDDTLKGANSRAEGIEKVSAAWIDCDLYSSTVPVLDYLTTRLSVGTVLLFDDWRCFRNQAHMGEQRACAEWLARNGQIRLNEFIDFGFHGKAFTVASC